MENTVYSKSEILGSIVKLIGFVLLFVAFYLALPRVDSYLKNKAVVDCSKISKFEQTIAKQNSTVTYPVVEVYKECLNRSGIK